MPQPAFRGVRILDMTHFLAGPEVTRHLANLGAQVIKVESLQHFDAARNLGTPKGEGPLYELSSTYIHYNRHKQGITLNLYDPRGVKTFKELARISDAVTENFPCGTLERLGVAPEALWEVNPTLVVFRMGAFGATGSWRTYPSFATSLGQIGGFWELTGYPDDLPSNFNFAGVDPINGVLAAFALAAGLRHRQRTGKGFVVDFSQLEAFTTLFGDALADYTMNGRVQTRQANRHPGGALQGVYPCQGEDRWVAITVCTDKEWAAFCRVLGEPTWCRDARFQTQEGRLGHHDELDAHIASWTAERDAWEVAQLLQEAGIAAGHTIKPADILEDPHLSQRGCFEEIERPYSGRRPFFRPAIRLSGLPRTPTEPPPTLGQHNHQVLATLLGLAEEELRSLEEAAVIGTNPINLRV
ncbi:MAG: CoA transferase [Chloroflexi bacterium]|nr:CoA transferase [Chloroflexota bacterium]